jgi:hypothetical protein
MYYALTEPGYRTVKAQKTTLQENQAFTVTTNNNRNTKYKRLVYSIPRIFYTSAGKF